ncbi:MAG: CPBP family intramembrane metalloprotease [Candidatus Lokiarchaeota archaeon]|nr:CPBP family intramembrane metalloprotease [Candidatus Lokiarchaeota archaeon]
MNDSSNSKHAILRYCPGCGKPLEWSSDMRYCMSCGTYLIKFIPKEKIEEWMNIPLTSEEIDSLYSVTPNRPPPPHKQEYDPQSIPKYHPSYRARKPWKWGAALGVPILAVLAKLILSVVILLVYMVLVIEDITNLDVNAFLDEHILAITIIEFSTQLVFLLIPFLFTAPFFPQNASKKERWRSIGIPFGLTTSEWFKEIGIGAGFSLIMTGLVYGVQWLSAYLTQFIFGIPAQEILNTDVENISVAFPSTIPLIIIYSLLMIFSIAPSEEVLFRGFTQKGFQNSFKNPQVGKLMALVITAIYFSAFHIYPFVISPPLLFFTFFPYFSLSLILGFLFIWRKNLISAITAHALYNIIQFLILIFIIT